MPHLNACQNLDDLLDSAILENLCTTMYCSTCGALLFRQKIADFLAYKMHAGCSPVATNSGMHRLSAAQVKTLVTELRTVTDGAICLVRPELMQARASAIDFVIRDVWNFSSPDTRDEWIRRVLGGSKAGKRYEKMLAHYKQDLQRNQAYAERNSPEEIARRKAENARLREERLQARAIRKVEIDRIWLEKGHDPLND